jgi:hypothetical protein
MLASPKTWLATALAAAIFLLCGCSLPSNPAGGDVAAVKANESPNSAEPVTAKTAYWPMYKSAYKWAPDIVLLRIAPKDVSGFTNGGGKAAVWEATFASPSKHEYRIFSYAIAAQPPDIIKGVTIGNAVPWSGVTREVMPIQSSEFNVDSDAVYTTAAADAATWLKKNPDKKMSSFQLGNGYSFPAPVWYVMWGEKKSGYVVFVSALNGKVLKK